VDHAGLSLLLEVLKVWLELLETSNHFQNNNWLTALEAMEIKDVTEDLWIMHSNTLEITESSMNLNMNIPPNKDLAKKTEDHKNFLNFMMLLQEMSNN